MNGMLLFAAKGLEVWFIFVAGLLVYDAQTILRRSKGDLPPDYALTHLEFSDLLYLFNASKWTRPIRKASRSPKNRRQVYNFYAFVLLACFLTILVNLMGPATGVLLLPSVQSVDQPHNASEQFRQMESYKPPTPKDGHGLVGCNADQLKEHLYSCAEYVRGSELDSMSSFVATPTRNDEETRNETGLIYLAESQEDNVHFLVFNFTYNRTRHDYDRKEHDRNYFNDFTVPSRQTLRMVSADTDKVINETHLMSKSLQVSSQRNGPAITVSSLNTNGGIIRSIRLGNDKSVTCLSGWMTDRIDDTAEYTKCIRNGTGWSSANSQAGFSIGNLSVSTAGDASNKNPEDSFSLNALVYFSDKATYYGGGLNRDAHDIECLNGNSSAPCNWDGIFDPAKVNSSNFDGSFSNVTIVEWSGPDSIYPDSRIWFEFVSYLQFGLYSVDLSFGNKMLFAHLENLEDERDHELVIDPLWTLAAWSVDANGTVDGARFPNLLQEPNVVTNTSEVLDADKVSDVESFEFYSLNLFAIAQTMSLISYESDDPNHLAVTDKTVNHVLYNWVNRRVWAYGLGTRTSRLGVAVVCTGMITVVFRVICAVYNYHHKDDAIPLDVSP
ncbi:hypothetical protein MMC07_003249 [Pseudocyphellaria aurata]|nr:hypothetical protein [Pseudocyphellaria aurata]